MSILGASNSAASKIILANMWTNEDTIIYLSRKTLWEKGEIARDEQFLLFPQCFQNQFVVDVLQRVSMQQRVNLHYPLC